MNLTNFAIDDVEFSCVVEHDGDMQEPWVEHDGHGVLRRCPRGHKVRGTKRLGEVVLDECWLYDVKASIERASQDSSGISPGAHTALAAKLKREPAQKEITAEAVRLDLEFCNRYILGLVQWYRMEVQAVDDPEGVEYLSGTLCDDADLLQELFSHAAQLAQQILYNRKADAQTLDTHYAVI
jgi:hypothetical protein